MSGPEPLAARDLTRYYGPVVGVEGLDLRLRPGEVYGLVGLNGAGKSTSLRLLLGLLEPNRGAALLFGEPARAAVSVRRRLGYLPSELPLYRDRTVLVALAVLLYAFEVLLVWIARRVDAYQGFQTLAEVVPDFVRNLFGFDIGLLLSFHGAVCLGYFHRIILTMLIAATMLAGRSPAGEVDGRTVELLIARPIRRRALVAASLLQVAVVAVVLPAAMFAGTVTGLALAGRLGMPRRPYLQLCGNVIALVLCLGMLYALFAASCTRTRSYIQLALGFTIGSYLLDFLALAWAPLAPLGPLSVFRYLNPFNGLSQRLPTADIAVLVTLAMLAAAAALVVFERRDL